MRAANWAFIGLLFVCVLAAFPAAADDCVTCCGCNSSATCIERGAGLPGWGACSDWITWSNGIPTFHCSLSGTQCRGTGSEDCQCGTAGCVPCEPNGCAPDMREWRLASAVVISPDTRTGFPLTDAITKEAVAALNETWFTTR